MILQEEFKKNGYKDILVKDNASKYDIDLDDILIKIKSQKSY